MVRGTLSYFASTLVFILSGYAIHIGLGRILGPTEYGIFGLVISISSVTYVFFNNGIQLAVSKFVSECGTESGSVLSAALKVQLGFGFCLTLLWLGLARAVSALLGDSNLRQYIQLSALGILPLALYEARLGFLNGKKLFEKHAIAEVVYSLCKVIAVFSFIYLGLHVYGAIIGYVLSAVLALIIVCILSPSLIGKRRFAGKKLMRFGIPVMIGTFSTSILMNIDLIFVKAIMRDNGLVGYYTSAINIAKPIWFLSTALGATLLPFVSSSTSVNDMDSARIYINLGLRYGAILLLPITLIFSADAENLTNLLYSTRFTNASRPMSILVFGFLFLSMFTIASTVITASGKPKVAMAFMLLVIPLDVLMNGILIPYYHLIGAALATTVSCFVGMAIALLYLAKEFDIHLDILSGVRIGCAGMVSYLIVDNISCGSSFLALKYLTALGVYIGLLIIQKEIRKGELRTLKKSFLDIIRRR